MENRKIVPFENRDLTPRTTLDRAVRALDSDAVQITARRLLEPLRKSVLREVVEGDCELVGFELTGPIPETALQTLGELSETLTSRSTPQHVIDCAELSFSSQKEKAKNGREHSLRFVAFVEDLCEFPPDVVATAFRKHRRISEFTPAPSEIRERCLREAWWRRSLAGIVARARNPAPTAAPHASPAAPTEAEKESVSALLGRAFPGRRQPSVDRQAPQPETAEQIQHRHEAAVISYVADHLSEPERGDVLEALSGLRGRDIKAAVLKVLGDRMRHEGWKDPMAEAALKPIGRSLGA